MGINQKAREFSLTQTLLASDPDAYKAATQSAFLAGAASGQVSKKVLGQWLANDRVYIHAYIRGLGRLLSFYELPEEPPASARLWPTDLSVRFFNSMVDFLVAIRREEVFFIETAEKYGLDLRLHDKLEGLRRFEALFESVAPGGSQDPTSSIPWLEAAIIFWGTEKCYLDAWSGAAAKLQPVAHGGTLDADGGALRKEFIPNWSSSVFREAVENLGNIIDDAVLEVTHANSASESELVQRALVKWRELLAGEQAFWPEMES